MTDFDTWYSGYPRKEAKGDARKAFKAALRLATLAELIEGRDRYVKHVSGRERQFIKLPATWLRAECWEDDYTETAVMRDEWDRNKYMDEFKQRQNLKLVEN